MFAYEEIYKVGKNGSQILKEEKVVAGMDIPINIGIAYYCYITFNFNL